MAFKMIRAAQYIIVSFKVYLGVILNRATITSMNNHLMSLFVTVPLEITYAHKRFLVKALFQ